MVLAVTSSEALMSNAYSMPRMNDCGSALKRIARNSIIAAQMGSSELGDGSAGSTDGGTFFTTMEDAEDFAKELEEMGEFMDDVVEKDLRRLFNVDSTDQSLTQSTEMDDLALMFKLRKELGNADFARIFEDPRIKGPEMK